MNFLRHDITFFEIYSSPREMKFAHNNTYFLFKMFFQIPNNARSFLTLGLTYVHCEIRILKNGLGFTLLRISRAAALKYDQYRQIIVKMSHKNLEWKEFRVIYQNRISQSLSLE